MPLVFLGLGSNLGDSPSTIRKAFSSLQMTLSEARLSRLWRSRPQYLEEQPDFVNAVAAGYTEISPRELLRRVNALEAEHGRDRSREQRKGPRPLDIDILLFGAHLVAESDLVIPHPGLLERKFALLPLLELAPDLVHPSTGISLAAALAVLPSQGIYLMPIDRYDRLYI